jgi:DNA helicase II / ATP-dependent DNA helicase PcrA
MQARVDVLVPYGQADTQIQTFHAFGDGLLREYAFELGLPGDVRLIKRSEAIVLLRENLFALGLESYLPLGDPTRFLGALVDLFHRARDEDVSAPQLREWVERNASQTDADATLWDRRSELARAYECYTTLLHSRGLIDHGDQIALPLRLLRENSSVREELHNRHSYLLVDEFQDMNPAQVALVDLLTGPARNVMVVGDPDQAIYTFRGAGWDNVGEFERRNSGLKRIALRRNYRSRQPIVDASRRLLENSASRANDRPCQIAHRRGGSARPVSVWC